MVPVCASAVAQVCHRLTGAPRCGHSPQSSIAADRCHGRSVGMQSGEGRLRIATWFSGRLDGSGGCRRAARPLQRWRNHTHSDTLKRGMTPIRSLRTLAALAADNLRASRSQAAYLIVTLAITTVAWLTLAALVAPNVSDTGKDAFGIVIRNGSQNSGSVPLHYARRIEAVRGARDVFWY